jgi:hypothetical protein
LYLGIACDGNQSCFKILKYLFKQTFDILKEEMGENNDFQADYLKIGKALDGQGGTWKMPASYHVTQLFIGGNKSKLESPIFKNFRENKQVDIEVSGVIYVPGKILTAICFPKADVENEFPHMTLMLGNGWAAKFSNDVLI